jgi:hypothetical protein
MKRAALVILVLFCACHSKDEQVSSKKDVLMFPFGDNKFSWKGIEKQNDELKNRFMKQEASVLFKYEHEIYNQREGGSEGFHEKDFRDAFHVIDVNNDGLDDFIYTGSTGGEGNEVAVVLNTGKSFNIIFKQLQHIVKLELKDNKLFRLYLLDDGCCADYVDFYQVYQANYKADTLQFDLVYLSSAITGTEFPKRYLKTPIRFKVLNDNYKMRENPFIDDTLKNGIPGVEFLGNSIDTLNKGTTGRAIAAKTDRTGRVWWFAEIDTTHTDHGNLFYEHSGFNSSAATKMGWISSRFVKQTND